MSFKVAVENQFDFTSAEYAALFARSAATAFQHPLWLSGLYARLLAPNRAEPLVITVRRQGDGALVLVLPLVRRRYAALRVVEFADLRVCDYVSPVADAHAFQEIADDAATRRQIRRAIGRFDVLRIGKLRHDGLPLERLLGTPQRAAMGMNAYAVPLSPPFESWRAGRLNPSYLKELDKKSRQLHRRGEVRFECSTEPEAIRASFAALTQFRRNRFGDGELLQLNHYADFYLELALNASAGFTRMYTTWLDGRAVASVLGLVHDGAVLLVMSGFAAAEFKNVSLGSLTFEAVARDCIARGDRLLDFTIGDEPYKVTFGGVPSPMWSIARAGSPLGFAAQQLVDRLPAAKALARGMFLNPTSSKRGTTVVPPGTGAAVPRDAEGGAR